MVYDFASVSEFIQYRLDVAGPLWPGMDAGTSKEVEDAFEATKRAVDIYQELARQQPDAFLPDLAMSLNNMGAMLS